jgi:FtsP/CotA-like multicopper oxidase with cupredoxin domain
LYQSKSKLLQNGHNLKVKFTDEINISMKKLNYLFIILLSCANTLFAQDKGNVDNLPVHEYTLTIKEEMVNKAGKQVKGMTVNGTIPGPTLTFTEGEYAVIYVKNEMNKETSVHWHGILLPNFYDGVPYLTTPPIKAGTTFKYEFPLKQSGTYWYHSHTMLQEQSGVFGSIVINPKKKVLDYDKDLVLMLSDWTNEKPMNVLRNLKRGNEWYQMKKGTSTPLNKVIARGAFGAQLDFWRQRMEGADIADVYYPAFLINGEKSVDYSNYKPGEKIRLRIINGAASTQFWMTFGGKAPILVSADGNDVVPVEHSKTFIGIAETYDFIITVPQNGKIELRAMAQDGSGITSAYFGTGNILAAEILPKPDKIAMMQMMAKMDMKMGAHALKYRPSKDERYKMKAEYGMHMEGMNAPAGGAGMGDEKMQMDMPGDSKMDNSSINPPAGRAGMEDNKMQMQMPKDSLSTTKMDDSKMNPPAGRAGMDDGNMKMDMSGDSKMENSKMNPPAVRAGTGDDKMKMDMSKDSKMNSKIDHSTMKMGTGKMQMNMPKSSTVKSKMNHSTMKMGTGKMQMKMDNGKMQMDMPKSSTMKMGTGKMQMKMDNGKMQMKMPKSSTMKSKMNHSTMKMGNGKMQMNMPKSSTVKSKMNHSTTKMGNGKMQMNMPKSSTVKSKMNHSTMKMGNGKMQMKMPKSSTMKMGTGKMQMNMPKSSAVKSKMDHSKMKMNMSGDSKMDSKMDQSKMNMKDSKMKMDMSGDSKMDNSKMKMDMPVNSKMDNSKMKMDMPVNSKMDNSKMKMDMSNDSTMTSKMDHSKMAMGDSKMQMDMSGDSTKNSEMGGMKMKGMDMYSEYNYDYLKSPVKTNFDKNLPVKEVLLNLTGNMKRYIWSMNGVPLSEADKIKISGGEVTRITFNNLTMMHHPMHLHGHFFRVLNKNGDYSPLKHTVNVPPMQQVTIEFSGNKGDEYGDWFLHCHILYHLMGGMARVVSYDTPRDPRMKDFPLKTAVNETDKFYTWSMLDVASHMTAYKFTSSNIRNQFNGSLEYGWNKNLEGEVTYERYLHDYLRVFAGVNVENKTRNSLDMKTTAVVGVRYLTPYLFNLDARVDSDLRPRISIGRSIMLFPRFAVFGYYEYQMDFGFVNKLPVGRKSESETVWNAGGEYFLSRNFSLMGSYDNRYGAGGGLSIRF